MWHVYSLSGNLRTYLYSLDTYMVIQYPGVRLLVYLECLFSQPNGVHETFKAAVGGISGVVWLEKIC